MKHIYIITIILSSFFTYKPLYAKDNPLQYAFFMPQDAFQYNVFKEDEPINIKQTSNKSTNKQNQKNITETKTTTSSSNNIPENKPLYKKDIKLSESTSSTEKNNTLDKNTSKKIKLSNISPKKETSPKNTTTQSLATTKESLQKNKSISEILSEIPYPNDNMLKYKKAYLDYIMSLRILYRTKKLQPNLKQENTLAKANSLKRFDI